MFPIILIIIYSIIITSLKEKSKLVKEYKESSIPVKVIIPETLLYNYESASDFSLNYLIDGQMIKGHIDPCFRYSKRRIKHILSKGGEVEIWVNIMNKKKFYLPEQDGLNPNALSIAVTYAFINLLLLYAGFRILWFLCFDLDEWFTNWVNELFDFSYRYSKRIK